MEEVVNGFLTIVVDDGSWILTHYLPVECIHMVHEDLLW